MLSRRWVLNTPIGVIVAIIGLLAIGRLYGEYHDAGCLNDPAKQECSETKEIAPPPVVSAPEEPPARNPKPSREEWRAEQDLQAQRDMAEWSFLSTIAAVVGAVVTAIGILFVWLTLRETRAAVAQAANAVEVSRDAYLAENRTWLKLSITKLRSVEFKPNEIRVSVDIEAENIGNAPALRVQLGCEVFKGQGMFVSAPDNRNLLALTKVMAERNGAALLPRDKHLVGYEVPAIEDQFMTKRMEQVQALNPSLSLSQEIRTLTVLFCAVYKTVAAEEWRHVVHGAVLTKADGTCFEAAKGNVPSESLTAQLMVSQTEMT